MTYGQKRKSINRMAERTFKRFKSYIPLATAAARKVTTAFRQRFKGNGGKSRRTSKKKLFQKVRPGTGISTSHWGEKIKGNRNGRLTGRDIIESTDNQTGGQRVTWGHGAQSTPVVVCDALTRPDFQRVVGSTPPSTRLTIKTVAYQVWMTNQGDNNVNVTLYDVVSRRDNLIGPTTEWSTGLTAQSGTAAYTNMGNTPFTCRLFCSKFVVKKVTKIDLSQGQSHKHYVKRTINRELNSSLYYEATDALYYRDLTSFTIAVCNGLPMNDSATVTSVSTGSGAVDFTFMQKTDWCYRVSNVPTNNYNNTFGAIAAGGSIMNEDTGAIVAEIVA